MLFYCVSPVTFKGGKQWEDSRGTLVKAITIYRQSNGFAKWVIDHCPDWTGEEEEVGIRTLERFSFGPGASE